MDGQLNWGGRDMMQCADRSPISNDRHGRFDVKQHGELENPMLA